ncbi:MAG: TraR/DksA family transcriptional regulator [Kiritimatiellia bacterium]|jgi:RNA polymerase-binding transcription factor DksA
MSLKKSKASVTPDAKARATPKRKAATGEAGTAAAKPRPAKTSSAAGKSAPAKAKAAVKPKSAAKPKAVAKATSTTKAKAVAKPKSAAKPKATAKARPTAKTKAAVKPVPDAKTVPAASADAKAKPAVRFSDADLQEYRQLLSRLRHDLVQKVAYLRDSSLRREDDVNHSEDGTDAFDRFFSLERAGGVQQRIHAIDEALREIDEGTYGICQSCESLIRKQRLLALPFARNCIECQAAQERKRKGAVPPPPRRFVP